MDNEPSPDPGRALADELLPCPHCAGTDIRFDRHVSGSSPTGEVWSMCCYHCGATFPNRYRKELLIERWNARPAEADKYYDYASEFGHQLQKLREVVKDAIDILTERKRGNDARSPSHNARVILETALKAKPLALRKVSDERALELAERIQRNAGMMSVEDAACEIMQYATDAVLQQREALLPPPDVPGPQGKGVKPVCQ